MSPGFTAAAILALGIGATSSVFRFVHSVLVPPLPVEDPSSLVTVAATSRQED
jgi:hypothetical protein